MKVKKLLCLGLAAAIVCSELPAQAANAGEVAEATQEGTVDASTDCQADTDNKFVIGNDGGLYGYNGEDPDVVIPEGVTFIGEGVFAGCKSMVSLSIPDSVTSIGYDAFRGCSNLASISIPDSVISIKGSAFYGCSSLASVSIPDSVTSIGEFAFQDCSNLASVSIPDSVTSIGEHAFQGTIWFENKQFLIVNHALLAANPKLCQGNITIPEDVTSIGEFAFSDCSSMTGVSIPKNVASIGDYAFYFCTKLTSASIPESVASIGDYAFSDCRSLAGVSIPEGVSSIGSFAFSGCSSLAGVSIPEGVSSIRKGTFNGCSSLTGISIPEGVSSIGERAFSGCSSLTSISLPNSVISIENAAFFSCTNLTNVSIPEGIITIGSQAFDDCSSLSSILIPKSVTSILEYSLGYYYVWNSDYEDFDTAPIPGFRIQGYPGTAAEAYAKENGFEFVALKEETPEPTPTPPAEETPAPGTKKTDITKASVALPQTSYTYTGKPLTPPVTVTHGGNTLSPGKDYTIAYADNINAGTAKITLTGAGGYQGSVTKTFLIGKAQQSLSGTKTYQKTYGGKAFTLNAKRTAGDGALSYSSSAPKVASVNKHGKISIKGTGVASITVTAKETANYAPQTFQVKVEVSPKKPALNTPKAKNGKKLVVCWKKDAKATGYEVWCSTDKNFKKDLKKATAKKNKTVSCQFSKLKAGKKYYVRLRSYKTVKVNGKTTTLRSKWSGVKQSKKIKK